MNSVTHLSEEVTLPFHLFKCSHKSHHFFSGLRVKTEPQEASKTDLSLQKQFCVIKYLMDVSFLPADTCSSSS